MHSMCFYLVGQAKHTYTVQCVVLVLRFLFCSYYLIRLTVFILDNIIKWIKNRIKNDDLKGIGIIR